VDAAALLDRLAAHRTLAKVPREELAWLVERGSELTIEPGVVLTPRTGPVKGFYIVLDGHLLIRVDSGAGPRIVMEWHGGDVTGVLPYSRIKAPPGDVVAEKRTNIFAIDPSELPKMIRECPNLTAVLVHAMLDRTRVFKSSELLDEKMISLGRLAAGLAHELNNPASAVARSAKMLAANLAGLEADTRRFCAISLTDAQRQTISDLRDVRVPVREGLSPLELADREEAIDTWLAGHSVNGVDASTLLASGIGTTELDQLDSLVGRDKLAPVLSHVCAGQTIRQLAGEIDTAASRIHALVAAVKGFTYVNQQATLQPLAIGQGLSDTITVLRSKAKTASVKIDLDVPARLPLVEGYGGELNQVWANLVDNAIDAAPGGHVQITARSEDSKVVVRVTDNGPGIPDDVVHRIFDPFFTTKDIGQGTGLGLDIARRIVQRHHGAIDVHTSPQGTEFCVTLPAVKPS